VLQVVLNSQIFFSEKYSSQSPRVEFYNTYSGRANPYDNNIIIIIVVNGRVCRPRYVRLPIYVGINTFSCTKFVVI